MRFINVKNPEYLPKKHYRYDCGFDCYLPEDVILNPHDHACIDLGFGINLKKNECAIVCMRSSWACENLIANTCPIDSGYTGNVHLVIHNLNSFRKCLHKGDRVCQIVIVKIAKDEGPCNAYRYDKKFGSSGRR